MVRPARWVVLGAVTVAIAAIGVVIANPLYSQAPVTKASGLLTQGLGINVHAVTEADLDRMARLGVHVVRMDMVWDWAEKTPGVYDWSAADRKINAIVARGMRPLLILDYSNPLYAPIVRKGRAAAPAEPRSRAAFVAWARAAVARYGHHDPIWEIWNEPDLDGFWPPKSNAADYTTLALQTCQAIRAEQPGATVWGPALSSINERAPFESDFLKVVLASNLPECLSAISVHPYAHWSKIDFTMPYWAKVNAIPSTTKRPYVASETGISNYGKWIQQDTQASYLVRLLIYDHLAGVPVTVWYGWKDDGADRNDAEHNYGLIDQQGGDKAAIVALQHLVSQTQGRDRHCLLQTASRSLLYSWKTTEPSRMLLIAWNKTWGTTNETHGTVEVDLALPRNGYRVTDLLGDRATVSRTTEQGFSLSGGRMPYYLHYSGRVPAACT